MLVCVLGFLGVEKMRMDESELYRFGEVCFLFAGQFYRNVFSIYFSVDQLFSYFRTYYFALFNKLAIHLNFTIFPGSPPPHIPINFLCSVPWSTSLRMLTMFLSISRNSTLRVVSFYCARTGFLELSKGVWFIFVGGTFESVDRGWRHWKWFLFLLSIALHDLILLGLFYGWSVLDCIDGYHRLFLIYFLFLRLSIALHDFILLRLFHGYLFLDCYHRLFYINFLSLRFFWNRLRFIFFRRWLNVCTFILVEYFRFILWQSLLFLYCFYLCICFFHVSEPLWSYFRCLKFELPVFLLSVLPTDRQHCGLLFV